VVVKFSERLVENLVAMGYSHCFFVAGGNIMHLLDAVRTRLTAIPVIHEVTAGIAAEYFNECRPAGTGKAFALVTAGPGLTNIVTSLAGAYLESRELLVVGGQVKSTDLSRGEVRQRGIQEIDGTTLVAPVCARVLRVETPVTDMTIQETVLAATVGRPGPVFMEICLDAQGATVSDDPVERLLPPTRTQSAPTHDIEHLVGAVSEAKRPILLIGGGVSRSTASSLLPALVELGVPLATTWNAADRVPSDHPLYAGRPNTWGQRWANLVIQQADLIVALGSRLGLQQTGFNWDAFAPCGRVIQVDIDPAELSKGHPRLALAVNADAGDTLARLLDACPTHLSEGWSNWRSFVAEARTLLPLDDPDNATRSGYISPFSFTELLSGILTKNDIIIPASSGGAFTVTMQALLTREGQMVVTNKGLASMGYGLAGAVGAASANAARRVISIEGDGGFAQNLQELGTVGVRNLNIKMFIHVNDGYSSIRMTQRNYFDGAWVGCDRATGLGLPDWESLFSAYDISTCHVDPEQPLSAGLLDLMDRPGPAAFLLPIDPEQTYFPKITSRVTESGGMESNPLHLMSPPLAPEVAEVVLPYLPHEGITS
jgi:acetolactate synthase-1/2/3 large subunit